MNIILNYIIENENCREEEAKNIFDEIKYNIENAYDRAEACSYLIEYNIPTDLIALFGY